MLWGMWTARPISIRQSNIDEGTPVALVALLDPRCSYCVYDPCYQYEKIHLVNTPRS